jgi:hypothetical protein
MRSDPLLSVLATRAHLGRSGCEDRPAAVSAVDNRFSQHAADQRSTAPATARTGADACALAHLLEGLRAALDRFDHRAFTDFVADAGGLEVLNHRLLSCFLF